MPARAESISYVKTHLAQVVDDVRRVGEPVLVTQKGQRCCGHSRSGILQPNPDALAMLKLVAMAKHDIGKGNVQSTEEVFAAAGARLRQRLDEQA